jgi:hypothetical protein
MVPVFFEGNGMRKKTSQFFLIDLSFVAPVRVASRIMYHYLGMSVQRAYLHILAWAKEGLGYDH